MALRSLHDGYFFFQAEWNLVLWWWKISRCKSRPEMFILARVSVVHGVWYIELARIDGNVHCLKEMEINGQLKLNYF